MSTARVQPDEIMAAFDDLIAAFKAGPPSPVPARQCTQCRERIEPWQFERPTDDECRKCREERCGGRDDGNEDEWDEPEESEG